MALASRLMRRTVLGGLAAGCVGWPMESLVSKLETTQPRPLPPITRQEAIGSTFQPTHVSIEDLGARGDGNTDNTDIIQAALNGAIAQVRIGPGVFMTGPLTVPSGKMLVGEGAGISILKLRSDSNADMLQSKERGGCTEGISLKDFTLDGAAHQQQRLVNGVVMRNLYHGSFDLEVRNFRGSGIVISGGGQNIFGSTMHVHANGIFNVGYGLYLFGSSKNRIKRGIYSNNCIGIAVEASGAGAKARKNEIDEVICKGNRADFGQSGAGIHFEQSLGGDCSGSSVRNSTCIDSTGVGINNTGCNLRIIGANCSNNRESAVTTIAAEGFYYHELVCELNAVGKSTGYRGEMRFDDSGLVPGSTGVVRACRLHGRCPDGGMRTMSRQSKIAFIDNHLIGYVAPYILSGKGDSVDGHRHARSGVFFL